MVSISPRSPRLWSPSSRPSSSSSAATSFSTISIINVIITIGLLLALYINVEYDKLTSYWSFSSSNGGSSSMEETKKENSPKNNMYSSTPTFAQLMNYSDACRFPQQGILTSTTAASRSIFGIRSSLSSSSSSSSSLHSTPIIFLSEDRLGVISTWSTLNKAFSEQSSSLLVQPTLHELPGATNEESTLFYQYQLLRAQEAQRAQKANDGDGYADTNAHEKEKEEEYKRDAMKTTSEWAYAYSCQLQQYFQDRGNSALTGFHWNPILLSTKSNYDEETNQQDFTIQTFRYLARQKNSPVRIIYLTRNPLDVMLGDLLEEAFKASEANSSSEQDFDLDTQMVHLETNNSTLLDALQESVNKKSLILDILWKYNLNYLHVEYEDLFSSEKDTAIGWTKVFDFLGREPPSTFPISDISTIVNVEDGTTTPILQTIATKKHNQLISNYNDVRETIQGTYHASSLQLVTINETDSEVIHKYYYYYPQFDELMMTGSDCILRPDSEGILPVIVMSYGTRSGASHMWSTINSFTGDANQGQIYDLVGSNERECSYFFKKIPKRIGPKWASQYLCGIQNFMVDMNSTGIVGFHWLPFTSSFNHGYAVGALHDLAQYKDPPIRVIELKRNPIDSLVSDLSHDYSLRNARKYPSIAKYLRKHNMVDKTSYEVFFPGRNQPKVLPTGSELIVYLKVAVEQMDVVKRRLNFFKNNYLEVEYEKLYGYQDADEWMKIFQYLGRGPSASLSVDQVKEKFPFEPRVLSHKDAILNYDEVSTTLNGTKFEYLLRP